MPQCSRALGGCAPHAQQQAAFPSGILHHKQQFFLHQHMMGMIAPHKGRLVAGQHMKTTQGGIGLFLAVLILQAC